MPSPFDITTASNTVTLDNKREGVAVFTVRNNTRRRLRAVARLTTEPPEGAQWLTLLPPDGGSADSANQREFPIDSTQQLQVKIAAPASAAPGSYTLRLTLADEVNPDENFSTSPDILFTVLEAPKPAPRPFPLWLIPVIILALVAIAAILFVVPRLAQPAPTATPTPTPTLTPSPAGPCLITIISEQLVYTRPEAIPDYIFDEARANFQLVPVGRLADNSWWQTNYQNSWIETSTFGDTAETSGDCFNLPIVFPPS